MEYFFSALALGVLIFSVFMIGVFFGIKIERKDEADARTALGISGSRSISR